MLKVGLTGGIGSGKTTVAGIFRRLGIPVFHADDESKKIADHHPDVRRGLINLLGKDLYSEGKLNRTALAAAIFGNAELLEKVNSIIHPAVRQAFAEWVNRQSAPYVMQEAAILFETKGYLQMDKNILVYAPQEVRIRRVMNRNQVTREEVLQRMARQANQEELVHLADYVILNDGNTLLLPQVYDVHRQLLKLAGQ
jgi:dephospho-CoA kinase